MHLVITLVSYMSKNKIIPGTVITLGDEKYIVPPCNFDLLERYGCILFDEDEIGTGEFDGAGNEITRPLTMREKTKMSFQLIIESIQINYPEVDEAHLRRYLNIANVAEYIPAIAVTSGLVSTVPTTASSSRTVNKK